MSGTSKSKPAEPAKRGEAAWRAHRDEIASRNELASSRARERRQEKYDQQSARMHADELRERAELARRKP